MSFKVKLLDYDGERSVDMTLPFVPFPGLMLQADWNNGGDFVEVGAVYWDAEEQEFHVYEIDEESR